MKDPESILRAARLARPSEALDRRIEAAFDAAAQSKPVETPTRMWHWAGWLGLSGIAALAIFGVVRPAKPPLHAAVVSIQYDAGSPGAMRSLLLEPPAHAQTPPHFFVYVTTQ